MLSRKTTSITTAILVGLATVMLAGCQEDVPQAGTNLEVADIKGIRFDEPLPAAENTSASPADSSVSAPAEPNATPAAASPEAPVIADLPTAADVPDDISKIPTATPVPTQAPEPKEIAAVAEATPAAAAPVEPGAYQEVSFKVLSGFKYVEPIPMEGEKPEDVEKRRQGDQIPAEVKALDGTNAIVQGWMVPMEISEDGAVKSFVLVKTQPECCFGDMQAMNEWVDVIMEPGKSAEFNVDQPVKVYGQLEVGEKTEDGFVLSVYRMKGTRVEI